MARMENMLTVRLLLIERKLPKTLAQCPVLKFQHHDKRDTEQARQICPANIFLKHSPCHPQLHSLHRSVFHEDCEHIQQIQPL
jgi:hypothetical protein